MKKIIDRLERLVLTFIAKKYVAWAVACWFLFTGKITGNDWVLLTVGIFCIDAYSKGAVPAAAKITGKGIVKDGNIPDC